MAKRTRKQEPRFPEKLFVRREKEEGEDPLYLADTTLRESMGSVPLGEPTKVAVYRLEEVGAALAEAGFVSAPVT